MATKKTTNKTTTKTTKKPASQDKNTARFTDPSVFVFSTPKKTTKK